MNGKERVKRAFAHQETDRVPVMALTIDNPTAAMFWGGQIYVILADGCVLWPKIGP